MFFRARPCSVDGLVSVVLISTLGREREARRELDAVPAALHKVANIAVILAVRGILDILVVLTKALQRRLLVETRELAKGEDFGGAEIW